MRGLMLQVLLTLKLNGRNPQALVFGYLVPVFFLIAFGSVFGATGDEMQLSLGKVLTIAALGGGCFGLPITLVAERERGVWRRYRLSPVGGGQLLLGVVLARLLLLLSSGALVVVVAMAAYGMPWPAHPAAMFIAYTLTSLSFIGLGLLIAMLATSVGAVQALGQCLFLPMLIIGGVAVPLRLLPDWALTLSRFMPGRHAVSALDHAVLPQLAPGDAWFALLVLVLGGLGCAMAALIAIRWDSEAHVPATSLLALGVAVGTWMVIGTIAGLWHLA
jgi:ABC-2 type transport system permease protein